MAEVLLLSCPRDRLPQRAWGDRVRARLRGLRQTMPAGGTAHCRAPQGNQEIPKLSASKVSREYPSRRRHDEHVLSGGGPGPLRSEAPGYEPFHGCKIPRSPQVQFD